MSDIDTLARTIWGEARGEGYTGMRAIAHVILNRVASPGWWGRDIETVCKMPQQFSCWNRADPNRPLLDVVTPSNKTFALALATAAQAIAGEPDPTSGATNYHTIQRPAWAGEWPPSWAAKMRQTTAIGKHVFYK